MKKTTLIKGIIGAALPAAGLITGLLMARAGSEAPEIVDADNYEEFDDAEYVEAETTEEAEEA